MNEQNELDLMHFSYGGEHRYKGVSGLLEAKLMMVLLMRGWF